MDFSAKTALTIHSVHCPTKAVLPLNRRRGFRSLVAGLMTGISLVGQCWWSTPALAQMQAYCQFASEAIADKENLLQASLKGSTSAKQDYEDLVKKHAEQLRLCRSQTWPQNQAIWLRLYPCDVTQGAIERILDRIVSRGYNQVYLEVFSDSQVLLPPADNPTPWIPVVRTPGAERVDLLAETIEKGRERGLEVYAWMFSLNFGYSYAQRPDRQEVLARNGQGDNSLTFVHDLSQAFVDPYNRQTQIDYYTLLKEVLERRPDGVLFDYIRYPRGTGAQSVANNVKDLWIYSSASRQALYDRAKNNKGRALIERYLEQGAISAGDIVAIDKRYPKEIPLWEGRQPLPNEAKLSAQARQRVLNTQLWYLSVAHAAQGILDFLVFASSVVQRQGLKAGAVFFPDGNRVVGQNGFDSRLQPWNNFPTSLEWHSMAYGVCGNTNCIVDLVKEVTGVAPNQAQIIPAIAGLWGQPYENRPSLEAQMEAIRRAAPQVKAMSHFAFSWQEREFDRDRRTCQL